jgi:hypothetical protein
MEITQCINSNAFNFSKATVETYYNYKKKRHNSCGSTSRRKYIKNKSFYVIHLCKNNFLSSTLAVSTSGKEAWDEFKTRIPNYIYALFTVSLGLHNKMHSMLAQLVRIKFSPCNQNVSLFLRYNFIPNPNCTFETDFLVNGNLPITRGVTNNAIDSTNPYVPNECINSNNYSKLCDNTYYNIKFYCDINYIYTPNFSNLPVYNCNTTSTNGC